MAITDSLDNAASAVSALQTQIAAERAAVLASVPAEASPTDILAAVAHNLFVSPADLYAALEAPGVYGSPLGAALTSLLGSRVLVSVYRPVYVDPVNGLNTNSGLTSANPVKTVEFAVTLGGAGQGILIYLMNDVSVSGANIASCPLISFFSSSTTRHTLTLTTGNLLFTGSSYVAMSTNYPTLMHFDGVDLKLGPLPATIGGFPVFGVYFPIDGAFNTLNCTFTRDPAAGAVLFATSSRTEFDLLGCTFVGSWPGNIFYGIAAGVNPNSTWSYSSNLTSA